MNALTATKPVAFVIDIKTIPTRFHLTNQPRQITPSRCQIRDATGLTFGVTLGKSPHHGAKFVTRPLASRSSTNMLNVRSFILTNQK